MTRRVKDPMMIPILLALVALGIAGASIVFMDDSPEHSIGTTEERVTITYDLNGGEGRIPEPQSVLAGWWASIQCSTIPTRDGYSFEGWSETGSSSSTVYNNHDTIHLDHSITLYAVWKPIISVSYDLNGGEGECPETYTVGHHTLCTITTPSDPVRDGFVFAGWSSEKNPRHYLYVLHDGDSFFVDDSSVVLYAVWSPIINITYEVVEGYSNGFEYTDESGTHNVEPNAGYGFMVYRFTVENPAYETGITLLYTGMYLKTTDARYRPSFNSSVFDTQVMGNVSLGDVRVGAGETHTYYAVYEIPLDDSDISDVVCYDPGLDWPFSVNVTGVK